MHRRAADGSSGEADGIEHGGRGEHARAADLYLDVAQDRRLFLRRILVCDRPARRLRGRAERAALREVVDLYDRAVDAELQAIAHFADGGDVIERLVDVFAELAVRDRGDSERGEPVERLRVVLRRVAADFLDVEDDDVKRALRRDFRIELAQRAGVTRQTIGLIESGDFNPSIKLCIAICKALDVTLNDIFWEDENHV